MVRLLAPKPGEHLIDLGAGMGSRLLSFALFVSRVGLAETSEEQVAVTVPPILLVAEAGLVGRDGALGPGDVDELDGLAV